MARQHSARHILILENRAARLDAARDALNLASIRAGQIRRRAPYLNVLVDALCGDISEAWALVVDELEDTQRERNAQD